MQETPNNQSEVEELKIHRVALKEKWDTQYAAAAHYAIDALLQTNPAQRNQELSKLRASIASFSKRGDEAGSYEPNDFQSDFFNEIVTRSIARIQNRQILDADELKQDYKVLDTQIYTGGFPAIDEDLIAALNSGNEHPDKQKYLEGVSTIADFISKIDINRAYDKAFMGQAMHMLARQQRGGFKVEDARKLRIIQDIILTLLRKLPENKTVPKPTQDWVSVVERAYLPELNKTKTELYKTANRFDKLTRPRIKL
jgi:hypothetical protein